MSDDKEESKVIEDDVVKDPKIHYRRPVATLDATDSDRLATIKESALSFIGHLPEDDAELIARMEDIVRRRDLSYRTGEVGITMEEAFLVEAADLLSANEYESKAVSRDGWSSSLNHSNGKSLGIGRRNPPNLESGELKGAKADMWVNRLLGSGGERWVPLPTTGISVTIKPADVISLSTFTTRVMDSKLEFGTEYKTFCFGNSSVYLREMIIDHILEHVVDSSLANFTVKSLRETIKLTDYPALIAGYQSTLYPDKYPFVLPCTSTVGCDHVATGDIFIREMTIFDDASITDEQKAMLMDIRAKVGAKELENYHNLHTRGKFREFQVDVDSDVQGSMTIRFATPTLDKHLEVGKRFVTAVNRAVHTTASASNKNEEELLMDKQILRDRLFAREFAHWVEKITVDDGDGNSQDIVELADIANAIDRISGNSSRVDKFLTELTEFMIDATITVVGLPKMGCPKCSQPLGERHESMGKESPLSFVGYLDSKYFVPLDVEQIFFSLALQRISRGI